MKTWIPIVFLLLSSVYTTAQNNIGIGTASPNSSAILDVTSTTQGMLIPRMTYTQKNVIPSPATGLMVYQTNAIGTSQSGLYFYDGTIWKRLARSDEIGGGGNNSWTIAGDDQYSNLAGNVGIGTSAPTSKFHLVGNLLTENGSMTINNPTAILQLQSAGVSKGFMQLSGNNVRIGTNSGNSGGEFIFRMNGNNRMVIDSTGKLGIGVTANLSEKMVLKGDLLITSEGGPLGDPGLTAELKVHGASTGLGKISFLEPDTTSGATLTYTPIFNYLNIQNEFDNTGSIKWYDNGHVGLGMGNTDATSKFQIMGGDFADLDNHHGYLMLGPESGDNLVFSHYEILARSNNAISPLYLQHDGGPVRIGNTGGTPLDTRLQISDGAEAGLSANGYLMLGLTADESIVMDNNDIQARDNGVASYLKVQQSGGPGLQVGFFNTGTHPDAKLYIPDGNDAGLSGDGMVHLGLKNSINMVLDENEIQARNNGAASSLHLQISGGDLRVGTNNLIYADDNGNVGIGTGTPISKLDVAGRIRVDQDNEAIGITGNNPYIGLWFNDNYRSKIQQLTDQLYIHSTDKVHLDGDQVAIGDMLSTANDYKLTVTGKIICEELKVELTGNWPDYVFADEYDLKPLQELKSFIDTNHHLPNIPKATDVEKEGFEVGEMNRKLLEKVEELTLYVISLQEQIDHLKAGLPK